MEPIGPMDPLTALVARAGVDGRRLRNALAALSDRRWWTLADLVRETATSRRTIEALLREVELERSGDRFRLPRADSGRLTDPADPGRRRTGSADPDGPARPVRDRRSHRPRLGRAGPRGPGFAVRRAAPADPVAHLLPGHADLVARWTS